MKNIIESQWISRKIQICLPPPELELLTEYPIIGKEVLIRISLPERYKERLAVGIYDIKVEANDKKELICINKDGVFEVTIVADEPEYKIKAWIEVKGFISEYSWLIFKAIPDRLSATIYFSQPTYNFGSGEIPTLLFKTDKQNRIEDFDIDVTKIVLNKDGTKIEALLKLINYDESRNVYIFELNINDLSQNITGKYSIDKNSLPKEVHLSKKFNDCILLNVKAIELYSSYHYRGDNLNLTIIPENPSDFFDDNFSVQVIRTEPEFWVWEINSMQMLNNFRELLENDYGPGRYKIKLLRRLKMKNAEIFTCDLTFIDAFVHPCIAKVGEKVSIQVIGINQKIYVQLENKKLNSIPVNGIATINTKFESLGQKKVQIIIITNNNKINKYINVVSEKPGYSLNNIKFDEVFYTNDLSEKKERILESIGKIITQAEDSRVLIISPQRKLYYHPVIEYTNELVVSGIATGQLYYMIPRSQTSKSSDIEDAITKKAIRGFQPFIINKQADKMMLVDPRIFFCPICKEPMQNEIRNNDIIISCPCGKEFDNFSFTYSDMEKPPSVMLVSLEVAQKIFNPTNSIEEFRYKIFFPDKESDFDVCSICGAVDKTSLIRKKANVENFIDALNKTRLELADDIKKIQVYIEIKKIYKAYWRKYRSIELQIKSIKKEIDVIDEKKSSNNKEIENRKPSTYFQKLLDIIFRLFSFKLNKSETHIKELNGTKEVEILQKELNELEKQFDQIKNNRPNKPQEYDENEHWKKVSKIISHHLKSEENGIQFQDELTSLGLDIISPLVPEDLKAVVTFDLQMKSHNKCECGGKWEPIKPPGLVIIDLDAQRYDPSNIFITKGQDFNNQVNFITEIIRVKSPETKIIGIY